MLSQQFRIPVMASLILGLLLCSALAAEGAERNTTAVDGMLSDPSSSQGMLRADRSLRWGTCGYGRRGNGVCSSGACCSQWGWCGYSRAHCGSGGPSSVYRSFNAGNTESSIGTCGYGNRGDEVCANGECCSQHGWCGTSDAHCSGSMSSDSTTDTFSMSDLQAGLDMYNALEGGSLTASQYLVNAINTATQGYSLYRKVAFVAHSIWESGGFQYTEELAAVTPPFTTLDAYQDCDFDQKGIQVPENGKAFYGRGFIKLSWCGNYLAYGADRMVNGDPDFFYNNPELVATKYAMDAAAWVFESKVTDDSGQFGLTTQSMNGDIECNNPTYTGNAPEMRFAIFDAIAQQVGLTEYSSDGCGKSE